MDESLLLPCLTHHLPLASHFRLTAIKRPYIILNFKMSQQNYRNLYLILKAKENVMLCHIRLAPILLSNCGLPRPSFGEPNISL